MSDFLLADEAMTQYATARLAAYYVDHPELYESGHAHEFWNGRLISYRDADPVIRALMLRWLRDAIIWVRDHYDIAEPLYADVLHLVGWREGMEMPVHADACERDGSSNGLAHRAFSGVYYLTEGHQGGGLMLPRQGLTIHPRRGRFVSLPCGVSHEHGVERVNQGLRITMAFFLTRDASKADPVLMAHV